MINAYLLDARMKERESSAVKHSKKEAKAKTHRSKFIAIIIHITNEKYLKLDAIHFIVKTDRLAD